MINLVRRRRLDDGRIDVFTPLKNSDGYFVLADRAVDPQHNKAANQFYIKDVAAVAARVKRGGVSLRMRGSISKQPNLISAGEIEILQSNPVNADDADGDPFLAFSEWAEDADEQAWRDL